MLNDFRNNSFDSLNVLKEKTFGFYGNRKSLVHARTFDEAGYIIQQDYYNEKRCLKKRKTQRVRYEYSLNRDTVSELHLLRDGLKWDTSYLAVYVFGNSGELSVKTLAYDGIEEHFEYKYDPLGNCISEKRSRPLLPASRVTYDYEYDDNNRITRFTRKNSIGFQSSTKFLWSESGLLLKKSTDYYEEINTYDDNGNVVHTHFKRDSSYLSIGDEVGPQVPICLEGNRFYAFDLEGRNIEIQYNCIHWSMEPANYIQLISESFEYSGDLLMTQFKKINITNSKDQVKKQGIKYFYKKR